MKVEEIYVEQREPESLSLLGTVFLIMNLLWELCSLCNIVEMLVKRKGMVEM